ncbi:SPFH domain-containing protein [Mucilaginibacter ximonensis]|uniref:SPFH domain-containing protein n=1 Tax=Mucilaginibacter ximonensis TaxID=538021 RepID=A0ABW5YA29_9SPHI
MGLLGRLMNEFIDVIEWVDNTQNTIVWKFPRYDNAIKNGAKLIVRESQAAVFMNEGEVADIFMPGTYSLETNNLPILTTLKSWKYGFNSPFKADIFFVSLRQFTNQKWGTKNPVIVRDAEFGPLRLRGYGTFNFRVNDPKKFIGEVSATNPDFIVEEINEQLRNIITSRGMDAIAQSRIPVLDIASHYDELGKSISNIITPDFNELGLELSKLLLENISLPPEVEQMLDKRSSMGIIGNLGAYAQFEAANAMEKSAENSMGGNLGAAGMGLGVGAAMASQIGNVFQQNQFNPNTGSDVPPPVAPSIQYHFVNNGAADGPHTFAEINVLINNGTIKRDTLIWKKGMANWVAANTVDDVATLFDNLPPAIS